MTNDLTNKIAVVTGASRGIGLATSQALYQGASFENLRMPAYGGSLFDPARFPVPGGITVPLKSFPEGEYRLEIKVTDKTSNKVLTRDVKFNVKA